MWRVQKRAADNDGEDKYYNTNQERFHTRLFQVEITGIKSKLSPEQILAFILELGMIPRIIQGRCVILQIRSYAIFSLLY